EGFSPSLPRGSDRVMGGLRAIVYAANRYQVAIYPIDPRSAVSSNTDDSKMEASTLKALAEQTGGEAALRRADLLSPLKQATSDLDDYYVVTYRASSTGDGKFHPVQLRVNRPDAQVRVRSGYWSADAALLRPSAATPAMAPIRPTHSSALIR